MKGAAHINSSHKAQALAHYKRFHVNTDSSRRPLSNDGYVR